MLFTFFDWYLSSLLSFIFHSNYLPLIAHFIALVPVYYLYVRVKNPLLNVVLAILLGWLGSLCYFFALSVLTLPYLMNIVTTESVVWALFAAQLVVPLYFIYSNRVKIQQVFLKEKNKVKIVLFVFIALFLSLVYFLFARVSYLNAPYIERFGSENWYTLHRRSFLYGLRNIGMAYSNSSEGLSLPAGYVVLNAYYQDNAKDNTWVMIGGYDYLAFILYLGITHALVIMLLGSKSLKKMSEKTKK